MILPRGVFTRMSKIFWFPLINWAEQDILLFKAFFCLRSRVPGPRSKGLDTLRSSVCRLALWTLDLGLGTPAHLARIEVGSDELPRFLQNGISVKVADALKQIGYAHVTVDLQGYRRGSLNATSPPSEAADSTTKS